MPRFMEAKRSHEAIFCTFAFYRSHDAKTEALRGDACHRERGC